MKFLQKSSDRVFSLFMATFLLSASLFMPQATVQAQPSVNGLTNMMQTVVIQSVTTSINSFAWEDEQEIQTANDGTVAEDDGTTVQTQTDAPNTETDNADASLRPGVSSDAVKQMQLQLMDLQFFDGDEATGYYGSITAEAVKLFQRTNGLTIDGIAGKETLALIYSDNAKVYTIKQGDSGTDVAALQRRLKVLKYFSGSATGYYGSTTLAAVKAFQKNNGLTVDGKAGDKTRDLVYSNKAKAAPVSKSTTKETTDTGTAYTGSKKSVSEFLEIAQAQLGKKYVLGNEGPNSFDCSGFVYYCLKQSGVDVGRLSAKGFSNVNEWTSINKSDLQPGDILFFGVRGSKAVGHTAIYLGNGKMIESSSSHGKVVIVNLSSTYWVENYKSARRVF